MNFGFSINDTPSIHYLLLILFSNWQSTHYVFGSPEPTGTNSSDSGTNSLIPPPPPLPDPEPQEKFNESSQIKEISQVTESNRVENPLQLPNVTSSWQNIRENNLIYIDKTNFLEHFLSYLGNISFFSRPRGFGKTVFLQTLKSFFKGEKHLFVNTIIYNCGNTESKNGTWIEYPVIHVDMSKISIFNRTISNTTSLMKIFRDELKETLIQISNDYELNCTDDEYFYLGRLVSKLHHKFQRPVVILIDEYDSVLQQAISLQKDKDQIENVAYIFDAFCGLIKAYEKSIKFAWLTGDTKLVKPLWDCGPDNFVDMTFDEQFSTAAGFTIDEIKKYMSPYFQNFPEVDGKTPQPDEIMDKLVEWYGGYSFVDPRQEEVMVLNPISVIQSLKNKLFKDYWCETGSKTLFDQLCPWGPAPSELNNFKMALKEITNKYSSLGHIEFHVRMFYMGYLKMEEYDSESDSVTLRFPNQEVKQCLENRWIRYAPFLKEDISNLPQLTNDFRNKISQNDIPGMFEIINYFGFVPFHPPWHTVEAQATARLCTLLKYSDIAHNQSTKFSEGKEKTAGNFDILTHNLPVNFVMQVKYRHPVEKAIDEFIEYAKTHFEQFREAISYYPKINVLIFNFTITCHLEAWANLLLEQGKIQLENMSASNDDLKKVLQKQHFSNNKIIEFTAS